MENSYSGGSWSMIPNMMSQHSNPPTPSSSNNQEPNSNNNNNLYLQQFQQPPQFQPQSQQQLVHNQFQQPQRYQSPQQYQSPQHYQSPQQHQQQQNQHQSLASHFHLLHLVENLGDAIENGTRDHHSDALVNELNSHFDKCQQLLNSISGSINSKAMTVDGQKRKLEESEQLLNQRRDLLVNYRNAMDDLIKTDL